MVVWGVGRCAIQMRQDGVYIGRSEGPRRGPDEAQPFARCLGVVTDGRLTHEGNEDELGQLARLGVGG